MKKLAIFSYVTGKSFSEALIFEPVNPQYDERLFIEFPQKIQVQNMLCTNIVLNVNTKTKKTQFLYTICSGLFLGIQLTISCHIVG